MDIRTFFNKSFSDLQIANKKVQDELSRTTSLLDSQLKEFEQVNSIMRGLIGRRPKVSGTEPTLKELRNLRILNKKLSTSVDNLLKSSAPQTKNIIKQEKKAISIVSGKILFNNLKIEQAVFKNVVFKGLSFGGQKTSQSSQNFYNEDNSLALEKIAILKRINDNLSNKPKFGTDESTKKDDGSFFGNVKGLIGNILGGSVIAKLLKSLLPFKKLGSLLGKGKSLIGKAGGRALPIAGAVFSVYDAFKTIKQGISDYKKFKLAGDTLAADGVISSVLMNVTGNIISTVGAFLPPPLSFAALAIGTGMTVLASSMAEKKGRTSGYIGEAREKTAKVQNLIEVEKSKGELLELRPNFKDYNNIYWEYNNGNKWVPIKDKSGENLSAMTGKNKIVQSTDPTKPGIQTYKIQTKNGVRELIMKNGNVYMIVPNVGHVEISTRKQGGSVVKNKTYVVGEKKAETYVPNRKSKNIQDIKIENKRYHDKQLQDIEDKFGIFTKDIKKIRNMFSSSSKLPNTTTPKLPQADKTYSSNTKIDLGKDYLTAAPIGISNKPVGKIGERYSKVKNHFVEASKQTGIPIQLLVKFAHIESGHRAEVGAGTSSAKGLFQFTKGTWNEVLTKYGAKFGLTNKADRGDPKANSLMGAMYIKQNIDTLKRIGLPVNEENLYLLHFLGPGGGPKLIRAALKTPNIVADTILPTAAASNKPVFYSNGVAKSVNEIYDWAKKKMDVDISYMNSYDVGAWNLKNDQEAFIHKGEMIIPAQHAERIRTAAKSGKLTVNKNEYVETYDIYSDSNFWINTFMPALANVVKLEFGETNG